MKQTILAVIVVAFSALLGRVEAFTLSRVKGKSPHSPFLNQVAKDKKQFTEWRTLLMVDSTYDEVSRCWNAWYGTSGSQSPVTILCYDYAACHPQGWKWHAGFELEQYQPNQPGPLSFVSMLRASSIHSSMSPALLKWPSDLFIANYYKTVWSTMNRWNQSVLHSDADAFWVKNPDHVLTSTLRMYPDADYISAQNAEPVPRNVMEAWGFVLNNGFCLFRNTPNMRKVLVEELMPAAERGENDQEAINHMLWNRNCIWTGIKGQTMVGQCGELKVVALATDDVSRDVQTPHHENHPRSVAHPDTGKLYLEGIDRLPVLRDLGYC